MGINIPDGRYRFFCPGCGKWLDASDQKCPDCGLLRCCGIPEDGWDDAHFAPIYDPGGPETSTLIATFAIRLFRHFKTTLIKEYNGDRAEYAIDIEERGAGTDLFEDAAANDLICFDKAAILKLLSETDDLWDAVPPEDPAIVEQFSDVLKIHAGNVVYTRFVQLAMARGYGNVVSIEI
jgi:hypothetical protein